ncbi:MAG: IS3 family transposase [Patescibacteria group bacterium]
MIKAEPKEISIVKQCNLLGINRSSLYYNSTPYIERCDKNLINEIIRIYELLPFYGYRRIILELQRRGFIAGKAKILRIKKELNLRTFYPEPKTSLPGKGYYKKPYLLKDLEITHSNQVWSTDITYIPVKNGFAYLVCIIDLYSRKILVSSLSNTMNKQFCLDALNEAITIYGNPEIFNSDQGSQFTSIEFQNILIENGIQASMDGKGRALDNIYIERYFRTLKYEDIYLNNYETIPDARIGILQFTHFYNTERFHSSLDYRTPDDVYFNNTLADSIVGGICFDSKCSYQNKHHHQNNYDDLILKK